MKTSKTAWKIAALIILAVLIYAGGFIHGQMHEAKSRIKLELAMVCWMKNVYDECNYDSLDSFLQNTIETKTLMLERMMTNPLAHLEAPRFVQTDKTFKENLPELKQRIADFKHKAKAEKNAKSTVAGVAD